jgi:hypothetical protein
MLHTYTHPKELNVLVKPSTQLTHTGQMFRIDSLGHVCIPSSPTQVLCSCKAMRNLSKLPSHMSVKPWELALNTICNAPRLDTRHRPTLPRDGPHQRSNPLAFSSSLRAKRLTEDYYASLAWLFKLVWWTQNLRYGRKHLVGQTSEYIFI